MKRKISAMPEVNFYQLDNNKIHIALSKLIEKAYAIKKNALIKTQSEESVSEIDDFLWSYDSYGFLPHSKIGDKNLELSPVHITYKECNPNKSVYMFLLNGAHISMNDIITFERTFVLFNSYDTQYIDSVRGLWKGLSSKSIDRKYWINDKGRWSLKQID